MVIPALSSGHAFLSAASLSAAAPGTSGFGRNQLEDLQTQVKKAGDIEIDGKGCTEFGIANVAKMLISAIFHDQKLVWPCSTLLRGEYGQHDVAAGVPCVIGKNGVEEILEVELTDEEQAKFAASCDILRGFLDRAASLKF